MRDPLPQPNHQPYDRPHATHVCGRNAEGDPCAFGPNAKGACPRLAECSPIEIDGQWQCDRPATRGGPCNQPSPGEESAVTKPREAGPTNEGICCRTFHCKPVRNLRSLRGLVVRTMFLMVLGGVLMMLGGSWQTKLLSPGPLTTQHAQLLRGDGWENRCAQCHAAAVQPFTRSTVGPTQSSKCMACHEPTISPDFALNPHNLSSEQMRQLQNVSFESDRDFGSDRTDSSANLLASNAKQAIACSVCHQEHHGPNHPIAAIDNFRCQSCHASQVESFSTDHPRLGNWPYERRTPIAFSHTTHAGKHFVEKNLEFACSRCHAEDATRGRQVTLSYEQSCAECHDQDIATSTAGGVALLAIPTIDIELLTETFGNTQLDLDAWPERAKGDFDGKLPPIMKLLLASSSPRSNQAIKQLGADFEFYDIDPDDPAHLQAAADLASGIRQLLTQLSTDPTTLLSKTQKGLHEQGHPSASKLLAGLSPSLIQQAATQWQQAATQWQQAVAPWKKPATSQELPLTSIAGTWSIENRNLSIRYQPTGHADPVLTAWINAAAALRDIPLRDALLAELAGPNSPGRCASCHSVDQQSDGTVRVHWQPSDRRESPRRFTHFSHTPHLLQAELRNCTTCHQMDSQAPTSANYTGRNPTTFVRDFQPIPKATCASCHTKNIAGDNCTQCHHYHVQSP